MYLTIFFCIREETYSCKKQSTVGAAAVFTRVQVDDLLLARAQAIRAILAE